MCFDNHSGYVTCVLALNSSVKYPNGLILTGGMDKEIYVFSPGDISPLRKLTGHTDTGNLNNFKLLNRIFKF